MQQRFLRLISLFFLLVVANSAHGEVLLPAIIGDNMVLQESVKVRIWGRAKPNEHVTVTFDNKSSHTTADAQGRWQLFIGPLKAGGPFELTVKGDNVLTVKNDFDQKCKRRSPHSAGDECDEHVRSSEHRQASAVPRL